MERRPLARPTNVYGRRVGNRFTTHPMEGRDGSPHGKPTDLVLRPWTTLASLGLS